MKNESRVFGDFFTALTQITKQNTPKNSWNDLTPFIITHGKIRKAHEGFNMVDLENSEKECAPLSIHC